jgi:hypothetical protein
MGKKNSGEPAKTRTRSPKSSGKPTGRGFTGHRGRGRGRSFGYAFDEQVGAEERPDSIVDDEDDDDKSEDATEGSSGTYVKPSFLDDRNRSKSGN